jgi:hypothetical protein
MHSAIPVLAWIKTGLTGEYDFTLFWDQDGGPVLSTALR